MGVWVPHDVRDEIVDFVNYWSERGELEARRIVGWVGIGPSKFSSGRRTMEAALRRGQRAQRPRPARPLDHPGRAPGHPGLRG